VARYRRSFIGIIWSVLQPTARMLVILFAFSYILGGRTKDYTLYLFTGIVFWNFFGQSVLGGMNSLRANKGVLLQLPVPMVLFPLAACLSSLVNLILMFGPLLIIMVVLGTPPTLSLVFVPVAVLIAIVFSFGIGLILGPLSIRFQDVVYLTDITLQLMFYMVPIMYPISIIPERVRWVVAYNPIRAVLELFRSPLYEGALPPANLTILGVGSAAAALLIGIVVMEITRRRVAYYI
jgi:ABC-2 type transport system permease protein/lipopolysaccharide transport system permease protein